MDKDRADFFATYNIDTSNNSVTYTCHECNFTTSVFRAERHVRSMRHIKNCNKGKCKVDLHNFKVIN
jgi:hypothetical protein